MTIDKNKISIIVTVLVIVVAGIAYMFMDTDEATTYAVDQPTIILHTSPYNNVNTPIQIYETSSNSIVIYISGEVNYPDVFELPYGSRVIDALNLAGGATENADLNRVNLASFLSDAQHVIIPAFGEIIVYETTTANTPSGSGLVNINTADLTELMTLSGIGAVIGQNIIDYRNANGNFERIEDIQNVNRIGAGVFSNIRDMITVN